MHSKVLEEARACPFRGEPALALSKDKINCQNSVVVHRFTTCPSLAAGVKKKAKPKQLAEASQAANNIADFVKKATSQGFVVDDFNVSNKKGQTPCFLAAERNLVDAIEALAELGVNLDLCDKTGTTPLLRAVQCGNSQAAVALLKSGAKGHLMDKKGNVPLREGINRKDLDCVEAILETGKLNVDIITSDKQDTCLLQILTTFKAKEAAKAARILCQYGPDLTVEKNGKTPLQICRQKWTGEPSLTAAVATAHSATAISKGVLNAVDKKGFTMLYDFAKKGLAGAAGGLIEKGADPLIVPKGHPSVMILAVKNGMTALVRPIIKALPEALKDEDELGNAVAMLAAYRTDPMEVRWWMSLLIENKVDLSNVKVGALQVEANVVAQAKSKVDWHEGATSQVSLLLELVRRGHVDAAHLVWDYLLECGHNVDHNEQDSDGRSLLFYSVYRCFYNDRTSILERILPLGVDLTHRDTEGTTVLSAACRANNFKAVVRLINLEPGVCDAQPFVQGGFDVNGHEDFTWRYTTKWKGCRDKEIIEDTDHFGNSPLVYASLYQNSYMMMMLLAAGADPNGPKDSETGMSPLMWAVRGSATGNPVLCRILMEAGADPTKTDPQGRTPIEFAFMHEFNFSGRPLFSFLKAYAGDTYNVDSRITKLMKAESKYLANKMDDDGTLKKELQKAYEKAVERYPDCTERVAARAVFAYERGKALINKLQKEKAKVVAAKAAMYAARMALMMGGGGGEEILQIGFDMALEMYLDLLMETVFGNADMLLEMDCSLVFDLLGLDQLPSQIEGLAQGCPFTITDTVLDVYEEHKKMSEPVKLREYGIDKYCDFMQWTTRKSVFKPLYYYTGPEELKKPKYRKGKPLPLRIGEYCAEVDSKGATSGAALTVVAVDGKTYTVEHQAGEHSNKLLERSKLKSTEVLEEKPRGDLCLSVQYDKRGFGQLTITCHGVARVSAAKSNGCRFAVQEDKWTPKDAMGKPLKPKAKKGEKAENLPGEHTFRLYGVKDVKEDSTISVVLRCDKKVGIGSMVVGKLTFYVQDLLKEGSGVFNREWIGLFSEAEPERLDLDEDEANRVAIERPKLLHLGSSVHEDVVELVNARMMQSPEGAFGLADLSPSYMPMDFTTPHMKVAQLKTLEAGHAKMAKKANSIITNYEKQQLVQEKLLKSDATYGPKAMMKYEKKGFKDSVKALVKTKTDAAKKKRRESKEKFTTDDASQIQEEAVDQAKTDFFEGAAYKQAKEGQERREFLAASIMERLRCKSLVEVYDLQLLFLNDVVVQQKKHAKVLKGDAKLAAEELSQKVQRTVESEMAEHFSSQVCNDRIYQEDFDFNRDWGHHEINLNKSGGHGGSVLMKKGVAKKPEKKQLRRRLSSVHLSEQQLSSLREEFRASVSISE